MKHNILRVSFTDRLNSPLLSYKSSQTCSIKEKNNLYWLCKVSVEKLCEGWNKTGGSFILRDHTVSSGHSCLCWGTYYKAVCGAACDSSHREVPVQKTGIKYLEQ